MHVALTAHDGRAAIDFTRASARSGPAAGGPRPAELCLARTETCNSQLVAGYLACGRVADDASNAPPGSRSRRF